MPTIPPRPFHILIYALGNYTHPATRHSLAQSLLPGLTQRWNLPNLEMEKKFGCWLSSGRSEVLSGKDGKEGIELQITLAKPRLAMNLSGQPLPFLLRSHSSPSLLVLHDSLEHRPLSHTLPRHSVSSKGHNGLRSIESSLKGNGFWRMGLGIGRPAGRAREGVVDWVMGNVPYEERLFWDGEGVRGVAEGIEDWARGLADGRVKPR